MVHGMLVSLPPWVRVAVLATACALILLSVGILAWLLSPACLGRLVWCRKRKRPLDNGAPLESKPKYSIDEELELGDVTYRSWARGSLYDTTVLGFGLGERDSVSNTSQRDSTYSSMSEGTDTSSVASMASGVLYPGGFPPAALEGPPRVSVRLRFLEGAGGSSAGSGSNAGRLSVSVLEARGLPPRDYGCSPDPCVQVEVARRSGWPYWPTPTKRRRQRPLHLLRTRTLRHSRQPNYNEDFAIAARKTEIKDWVLQVSVVDDCRLRGPSTLCSGELRLRGHADRLVSGAEEAVLLSVQMQAGAAAGVGAAPRSRGLLLFGLSYLPTSQRLSITIIKACRLQVQHVLPGVHLLRPYVRATLVQASSGRRVQSVRTEPQDPAQGSRAANPEFCETLCLKLAPDQLSSLSLVVAVCHRLPDLDSAPAAGGDPPPQPQRTRCRDRVIGAVALGSRVLCDRGREHWRAIEQRPRRVISVWHTLT